jgi:hypothetical protein
MAELSKTGAHLAILGTFTSKWEIFGASPKLHRRFVGTQSGLVTFGPVVQTFEAATSQGVAAIGRKVGSCAF